MTYILDHAVATHTIHTAVRYLVQALEASEEKLGSPIAEISSEFTVGLHQYNLTLARLPDGPVTVTPAAPVSKAASGAVRSGGPYTSPGAPPTARTARKNQPRPKRKGQQK